MVASHSWSSSSELVTLFAAFDKDSDGRISSWELCQCMKATLGEEVSAEEAEALVASEDADGDGHLDAAEFVRLVAGVEVAEEEHRRGLREAFRLYEMVGLGCITATSLKEMLGRLGSEQGINECRAMICRFDLNGDGVLTFDEFMVMMSA